MMKLKSGAGLWSVVLAMALGCSQSGTGSKEAAQSSTAADAAYLLTEKPGNSQGVAEARKGDAAIEEVTIEGRIGGSEKPFVDGVAAFTIVDPAIPYCAKEEGCPTPWDYCCNTDKLKDNSALIKIVSADGQPVSKDARELLGVKELSRVIVKGKAQRDKEGNLTVLAEKVHITQE